MTVSTLRFEEIREGDQLPPLEKRPELLQVVKWSGATWTFVPIFYDRDLARSQGLPDSVIPGPMKLAYFALLLRRWAGPAAHIRSLRATYRRPDTPGQPILCRGMVTRTGVDEGRGVLEVEVWAENHRGERSVAGVATVEMPLDGAAAAIAR